MRSLALLALLGAAACGGDDDAPPVMGPCVPDVAFYGELLDWGSIAGAFEGISGAAFSAGGESATSAPNGRVELCLPPGERHEVAVAAPEPYLDGTYVADADLFADGITSFSVHGATPEQLTAQYTDFGLAFDASKAQLLVEIKGTAGTPTLTGAAAASVRYLDAAKVWQTSGPGTYALFLNVEPGTGTVALAGSDGGGSVPLAAGGWTMTTLVAP
jgi:hypothetical protein